MNTQISSKLAALTAALLMNTIIIGGMSVLFNSQLREQPSAISIGHPAADALRYYSAAARTGRLGHERKDNQQNA